MFYKSTTTIQCTLQMFRWIQIQANSIVFVGKLKCNNKTLISFQGITNLHAFLQGSKWYTENSCNCCGKNIYSIEAYERRTVFFNHLFPTTVNSCQDRQLPILIAPVHKYTFWQDIVQNKCSLLYLIQITNNYNLDWYSNLFD